MEVEIHRRQHIGSARVVVVVVVVVLVSVVGVSISGSPKYRGVSPGGV